MPFTPLLSATYTEIYTSISQTIPCFGECKKIRTLTEGPTAQKENKGTFLFKAV